jgi:hydroxybutyrate-dimer hydrolase
MSRPSPAVLRPAALFAICLLAAACGAAPVVTPESAAAAQRDWRVSTHRGPDDDLLTAGLGLDGLRAPVPPPVADAEAPTAAELRRRAVWSNWRGIADVAPGGGLGDAYGRLDAVEGREFHALRQLPGAAHPHRVMVQVPDGFARSGRCLVVTASSGSRGIYGAIAIAGGWGLPRGCAVAHTDKGTGTGWFDTAGRRGARLDGTPGQSGEGLEFDPGAGAADGVLFKHAHSGDNPEADWGRHLRQAAEFALEVLNAEQADGAPWDFASLRVLALAVSNGGGAALQAAGIDGGDWLDGVVAVAPNIHAPGARPLYDLASEAALLMPCALAAAGFEAEPMARPGGRVPPAWSARCAALHAEGLLPGAGLPAQADEALARLQAGGWTAPALATASLATAFDLWRAVVAPYAAAYTRSGAAMPCGYRYALLGSDGLPRPPTAAEHALWWSDTAGIPPAAGVALLDPPPGGPDPALPGLRCLRGLLDDDTAQAAELRRGIAATVPALPRPGLPVLVMHGLDDGLVPEAHTSAPYVDWLRREGRSVRYWRIGNAQHFDAFLGLPPLAARYLPLLPYAWAGMDALWAHVASGAPLPPDADIRPRPRAATAAGIAPLRREDLALP